MSTKLKDIHWEQYSLDHIKFTNYSKETDNDNQVIYKSSKSLAYDNKLLSHIDIHYLSNPLVYVTTPTMIAPFGFNKDTHLLYLQFTNVESNTVMKSFYDFINYIEFQQMRHIGIQESNMDDYLSQIKQDKQNKYDPNLVTKVPYRSKQNRFDVSVFNKNKEYISLFNIPKFAKLQCDIYIDKIWKYNDKYVCKWKVKQILFV